MIADMPAGTLPYENRPVAARSQSAKTCIEGTVSMCAVWLVICSASAVSGLPPLRSPSETAIATVGGCDQLAQLHVATLLLRSGIRCDMEGSIVYGVLVPTKDAARALAILRADLKARPYRITLDVGNRLEQYAEPSDVRRGWKPRVLYDDLVKLPNYGPKTDIGGVLRQPDVVKAARAFPYVEEIVTVEQSYFDPRGRSRTGHRVELQMTVDLNAEVGGARFWFEAWDDGRQIAGCGSNEWWQGDKKTVAANQKRYDHRKLN